MMKFRPQDVKVGYYNPETGKVSGETELLARPRVIVVEEPAGDSEVYRVDEIMSALSFTITFETPPLLRNLLIQAYLDWILAQPALWERD